MTRFAVLSTLGTIAACTQRERGSRGTKATEPVARNSELRERS